MSSFPGVFWICVQGGFNEKRIHRNAFVPQAGTDGGPGPRSSLGQLLAAALTSSHAAEIFASKNECSYYSKTFGSNKTFCYNMSIHFTIKYGCGLWSKSRNFTTRSSSLLTPASAQAH